MTWPSQRQLAIKNALNWAPRRAVCSSAQLFSPIFTSHVGGNKNPLVSVIVIFLEIRVIGRLVMCF